MPPDITYILPSLTSRQIAISDTITSCQRHDFSSEDTKLVRKTWNKQGVLNLIRSGVSKILCTSKGVLSDLEKKIICPAYNAAGEVDLLQSAIFQNDLINNLNGNPHFITNPIARIFNVDNRKIEVIAIPSPGSPQRQIKEFGFDEANWEYYSNRYYATALTWLTY